MSKLKIGDRVRIISMHGVTHGRELEKEQLMLNKTVLKVVSLSMGCSNHHACIGLESPEKDNPYNIPEDNLKKVSKITIIL